MTTIVLGCDSNGNDRKWLNGVARVFRQAGYKVEVLSIGPNPFSVYSYSSKAKGKIGVYLMAASLISFLDAAAANFDYNYFIIRSDASRTIKTEAAFNSRGIPKDWDGNYSIAGYNKAAGKTYPELNSLYASRCRAVFGANPEAGANAVVSAMGGAPIAYSGTGGAGSGSSTYSGSLQGNSDDNISPLLKGEMTFEELVGEICHGIDLMFLCKRSTVVVTDFSTIFAEAKYLRDNHYSAVSAEDIKLYQLDEDSYELNIDQHGFYNTVYVEYNKGVVKETFDQFVKSFGEVSITYKDPKIDKTTAIMKAKSYLAAHLRDFEMQVKATILTEPDIDIGDIVTLDNPQTHNNELKTRSGGDAEYLFVKGVNTSWDGDGMIQSDLELQFSPTSPSKKEVPTSGTLGTLYNKALNS